MFGKLTSATSLIRKWITRHWAWLSVVLVILFMVAVRVRLREMPLERDEGEYAYAGQLMLQGIPPYKLAYNMKLPGTYAAYAVLMAVFGQSIAGVHLGLTLVNAASIVLIFLVGRRMLDDVAGVVAAVNFAFMSLSPSVLGLQAHATHFVVLPMLGGVFLLLRAAESGRLRSLFASGILFGIAFVMKQHGVLFGVFGFFYLVWVRARIQKEEFAWSKIRARSVPFNWRKYWAELGAFSAGMVLPYFAVCLVLWCAGVFSEFAFWTISYAGKYITAVPLANGAELFRESMGVVTSPSLLFWLLAAFGAGLMWSDKRMRRQKVFLAGLFVCSWIAMSLGLYFRAHYFILLLPALALLGGTGVSHGIYFLKQTRSAERFVAVPAIGLFLLGLCWSLIAQGEIWFGFSPAKTCGQIYGDTLFSEAVGVGRYLRASTGPKASIAVLGSEPEIYFYARRHSATGYIYMYPLREAHSYAVKMQEDMIHTIESSRPEYIVFVTPDKSWLPQPGSKSILQNWWPDFWTANYDLVRNVNVESTRTSNPEDVPEKLGDIMIFKRKSIASK